MTGIYLLLGSNLGNMQQQLLLARNLLERRVGKVLAASSVYRTEAWNMEGAPDFFNQVLELNSGLEPLNILEEILGIERGMGRMREKPYQNRIVDIDILYYNDQVSDHPELTIPHPRISQRRFVLEPLVEIAPDFVHPVLGLTNKQMLDRCTDQLSVKAV